MFLAQGLEQTDGASVADIATCQEQLGVNFPVDLAAFLARSNGAEGSVGDGYLAIYAIEAMVELNEIWWEAWPDRRFVAFASDGGGETYALDTSFDPPLIVEVPFASTDVKDQNVIGTDLADLLRYTRSGRQGSGMSGNAGERRRE